MSMIVLCIILSSQQLVFFVLFLSLHIILALSLLSLQIGSKSLETKRVPISTRLTYQPFAAVCIALVSNGLIEMFFLQTCLFKFFFLFMNTWITFSSRRQVMWTFICYHSMEISMCGPIISAYYLMPSCSHKLLLLFFFLSNCPWPHLLQIYESSYRSNGGKWCENNLILHTESLMCGQTSPLIIWCHSSCVMFPHRTVRCIFLILSVVWEK